MENTSNIQSELEAKLKQMSPVESLCFVIAETMKVVSKALERKQASIKKLEQDPDRWLIEDVFDNQQPTTEELNAVKKTFKELKLFSYFDIFQKKSHIQQLEICRTLAGLSFHHASQSYEWISSTITNDNKTVDAKIAEIRAVKLKLDQFSGLPVYKSEQVKEMSQMIQALETSTKERAPEHWYLLANDDLKKALISLCKSRLQLLVTELNIVLETRKLSNEAIDYDAITKIINEHQKFVVDVLPSPSVATLVKNFVLGNRDEPNQGAPGKEETSSLSSSNLSKRP